MDISINHKRFSPAPQYALGLAIILAITLTTVFLAINNPAIIILLTLTVFVGLIALQQVRFQVMGLLALLPFIDLFKRLVFIIPEQSQVYMYAPLIFTDILLVIILLRSLPQLFLRLRSGRLPKLDLFVLLFGTWAFFSSMLFTDSRVPLFNRLTIAEQQVFPILMYYVGAIWLSTSDMIKLWRSLLIPIAIIMAIYGIFQLLWGLPFYEQNWIAAGEIGRITSAAVNHILYDLRVEGLFRAYSTTSDHVSFGTFMALALCFQLGLPFHKSKIFLLITVPLFFIGILVTFTRMVWILPILVWVVHRFFYLKRIKPILNLDKLRKPSIIILGLGGSYLIFVLVFSILFNLSIFRQIQGNPYLKRSLNTASLEARLRSGQVLEKQRFSIAGEGLSSTGQALTRAGVFESSSNQKAEDVNFHNIFIDMLEEMGVIGVLLFLLVLFYFYKQSLSRIDHASNLTTQRICITIVAMISGLLIIAQIDRAIFFVGELWPYYFWGMTGAVANFRISYNTPQDNILLEIS